MKNGVSGDFELVMMLCARQTGLRICETVDLLTFTTKVYRRASLNKMNFDRVGFQQQKTTLGLLKHEWHKLTVQQKTRKFYLV